MRDEPTSEPVLRPNEQRVAWRSVDGEAVLLDLETSTYLTTNPSATVLWERLADGATRAQLIDALTGAFDISADRAAAGVDGWVAEGRRRGLLAE